MNRIPFRFSFLHRSPSFRQRDGVIERICLETVACPTHERVYASSLSRGGATRVPRPERVFRADLIEWRNLSRDERVSPGVSGVYRAGRDVCHVMGFALLI